MKITDVKKLVKKYITNTVIIVGLGILASVSMYTVYNSNSKLKLIKSELAATTIMVNTVTKEKARLDSLAKVHVADIASKDGLIASKDREIAKKNARILALEDTLKQDLNEVAEVTADSSYQYINERVKPVTAQLYPFDSTQVKFIHYTLVERDGLYRLNVSKDSLVTELQLSSSMKDNQILSLKSLNNVYINQRDICKSEGEGYIITIDGLNKALKQQKLLKTISNGTAAGLAGYIIFKALFN